MATINGLYVFIETEDYSNSVSVTEHAVEEGLSLSDNVQKSATTLSLKGSIVGANADSTIAQLERMQAQGTLVSYSGVTSFGNCVITSFSKGVSNASYGGYTFTIELKQVRIASSPYTAPVSTDKGFTKPTTSAGTQQKTKKSTETWVYHTVKKGDTVWALANGAYKSLGSSCNDIMNWNPSAFSRKGDFTTLQIGAKLKMGKRK